MQEGIFATIRRLQREGKRGALCTIISSKGSLPMSGKAKMLVTEEGTTLGTVGGGCLEADVWSEAKKVMKRDTPRISRFILTEKHAGEAGLNCGGVVEIFIEPIVPGRAEAVFETIAAIQEAGKKGAIATVISGQIPPALRGKAKLVLKEDGTVVGQIGSNSHLEEIVREEALQVMEKDYLKVFQFQLPPEEARRWGLAAEETLDVFLEPIIPIPTLYLFGGGHVSLFVAKVAKLAGFRLVVIDDRPAFANTERFPEADEVIVADFSQVFARLPIDDSSYIVSVTRGHQYDDRVIEQAVKTPARYIGMIGSKRKVRKSWEKLEARGIPRHLLERVHAPIGLDINADTPAEIAISIVAQMIQVRRGHKDRRKLSNYQRVSLVAAAP
ncbi:MAG: XdhC/CoxI family protein [Nitrospinota bacterium]|nr:MAG: XdhC/CoxI family protein [Nitrospinota bacterium]